MVITVNNIMVKVEGLSKEFRGEMILQDVNITLERGKIYGLVGMNGSGKTVFMKCLCGFLKPTTGKVTVDGKEVGKEIDFPQDLGLMIETPGFIPYMSGKSNLKNLALIRNQIGNYEIEEALRSVGLDPKQIIEIRELIRKLAKKHTVILSSHILAEVREVCDYIMIISGGKLVASDTTENLENMMSGKGQIEVEAKASRDEMDHIIRRTGKIKEVKYRTSASSITTAQIIAKGGEDIREELFLAFSHADVPMLTLSQSKTTLEEIFLELTQGSGNRMIKEEK